jgi:hypothetical protein
MLVGRFSNGGRLCPPAPTLSTQPLRYATHNAWAGGGRATSDASRRKFWAMAARTNSSWAPCGPRSRSRPSFRMRFKCANRILIFLRSCRDCSKLSVPASDRAMSRAYVGRNQRSQGAGLANFPQFGRSWRVLSGPTVDLEQPSSLAREPKTAHRHLAPFTRLGLTQRLQRHHAGESVNARTFGRICI